MSYCALALQLNNYRYIDMTCNRNYYDLLSKVFDYSEAYVS
jgi:hypothetical protein